MARRFYIQRHHRRTIPEGGANWYEMSSVNKYGRVYVTVGLRKPPKRATLCLTEREYNHRVESARQARIRDTQMSVRDAIKGLLDYADSS